jgi:acyl carrier protein
MSLRDTALAVIARVSRVEAGTISPEMDLVADLDIDSAKALELLVELEDALGVEISDEQAAGLKTVSDILAVVAAMERDPDA